MECNTIALHRFNLALVAMALLMGCADKSKSPAIASSEASWSEQVSAVSQGKSNEILIEAARIDDAQMADLSKLEGLKVLKLQQGAITDRGILSLKSQKNLEHIVLRNCPISDDGATALVDLPSLRIVNIPQSEIGDEGIEALAKIPRLELLRLGTSYALSVEALTRLTQAKNLRFIHFIDIPLTDESLSAISQIETLESLYLDGGTFSDEALANLLKKRPKLHLHLDQQHHDSDPKSSGHHQH